MASAKLFVRSLNYLTRNEALHDHFSKFGPVVQAHVVMDALSGRSRGFGFVTFKNAEDMQKAIDPSIQHEIDGKPVFANQARDRPSFPNAANVAYGAGLQSPRAYGSGRAPAYRNNNFSYERSHASFPSQNDGNRDFPRENNGGDLDDASGYQNRDGDSFPRAAQQSSLDEYPQKPLSKPRFEGQE